MNETQKTELSAVEKIVVLMIAPLFILCVAGFAYAYKQWKYPPVLIKTSQSVYVIDDFSPPKHVYVTLRRQTDGKLFQRQYVSKHWNEYASYLQPGRKVQLQMATWRQQMRVYDEFYPPLREQFEHPVVNRELVQE